MYITFQADSPPRDFIDRYLHEMTSNPSSSFLGVDGDLNLMNVVIDLFIAGSDTTSNTLNWGVLFMLNNPEVQERVREELDSVTGRSR